jgi:uncharacterized protein YcfJ
MRPSVHLLTACALLAAGTGVRAADMATVVSATAVTASVPTARQVCSEGRQIVQPQPSGVGSLVGAIAGGLIGHGIGDGFGRAAATGIGAVAGAAIGNQVEANGNPAVDVPVRRCQNVTRYENRVIGYDVVYEYAGQRYSTRMDRDPGRQFAVSIQPADPGGGSVPAPAYSQPAAAAEYAATEPVYYEPLPRTVYYTQPAAYPYPYPYYAYPSPAVTIVPAIGIGFGFGWGGHRGHRH